jgi:hypothetical protein
MARFLIFFWAEASAESTADNVGLDLEELVILLSSPPSNREMPEASMP